MTTGARTTTANRVQETRGNSQPLRNSLRPCAPTRNDAQPNARGPGGIRPHPKLAAGRTPRAT
eukprot:2734725-Lingulodinium_polyedra.AAC.1